MKKVFKNCILLDSKGKRKVSVAIDDGLISSISNDSIFDNYQAFDFNNLYILPGLMDVHTHLRDPGFLYKEDMKSGTMAAAAGGFTNIITMANLNPVPDTKENLEVQMRRIKEDAIINVFPLASITKGELGNELVDFDSLNVVGFSDDGKGVENESIMKEAMIRVKAFNGIIVSHCEDESLVNGGYIHAGDYARRNGHKGIVSSSEYLPLKRDINLLRETGCKYHVCHVSTKESVELIRQAKREGLNITCETAPHYIYFNHNEISEDGRFKMNPPIRDEEDRLALIEGLVDGTIDVIATDHAPHSLKEKSKGLRDSAFGVVGLETSFASSYTTLVKGGYIDLNKLIHLMSIRPREIFGITQAEISTGKVADFFIVDIDKEITVKSREFLSKGRATPFEGEKLFGEIKATVLGDVKYLNGSK